MAPPGAGSYYAGTTLPVRHAQTTMLAYGVPALTIMGAISVSVSRVYPPLAWGAANVFEVGLGLG